MSKFNIGDVIKVAREDMLTPRRKEIVIGKIGTILKYDNDDNTYEIEIEGCPFWVKEASLKLIESTYKADLIDKDKVLKILYEVKDNDTPVNRGTIMDIIRRVRELPCK